MIIPLRVFHQFIFSLMPFLHPYLRDLHPFLPHLQHCFSIIPLSLSLLIQLLGSLCLSCFFLLYFLCHVHWARLPRQCSDQPEIQAAYMAFLMLCLYKKMGLRMDSTRESRRAMIQSDPDANSLLYGHFIFLICTIFLSPVGN